MKKITIVKPLLPNILVFMIYVFDIWRTKNLSNNGKYHSKLEFLISKYLNVSSVLVYSSGHLALEAAIDALELNGEVITTPFTFASTTQAIIRRNLTPVFCDIDRTTYTIDADKIESLITKNTSAIIPVHVYGNVCDVEKIQQIADKYNLKVIYDAAHSFGVKYKHSSICNYGDISMLSFQATKIFNTLEGGAVVFSDKALSNRLKSLKNFGMDSDGKFISLGGNAKMNELQAIVGVLNLKKIDREIARRRIVFDKYQASFLNYSGIEVVAEQEHVDSNYSYYSILITNEHKSPKDCVDYLNSRGIIAKRYFYPLTSELLQLNTNLKSNATPVAKYVSDRVVALPIYGDMKKKEVLKVVNSVKEYMEL